jgi:hypothetical protein
VLVDEIGAIDAPVVRRDALERQMATLAVGADRRA